MKEDSVKTCAKILLFDIALYWFVQMLKLVICASGCLILMEASRHLARHTLMGALAMIVPGALGLIWCAYRMVVEIFKIIRHKTADKPGGHDVVLVTGESKLSDKINQLSRALGIAPPTQVHFTAAVNAAVYMPHRWYNIWRAPRKLLILGLGLINSLNVSEFEGVLAHELAHVSQRAMMLSGYVQSIERRIRLTIYTRGRAWLPPVRLLFDAMTAVYLKRLRAHHNALSHALELHADACAAKVVGGHVVSMALQKSDEGELRLHFALSMLSKLGDAQRLWTDDLFYHQNRVGAYVTQSINQDSITHPSHDDRAAHTKNIQASAPQQKQDAWTLIKAPNAWRKLVTAKLQGKGSAEHAPPLAPAHLVHKQLERLIEQTCISPKYQGYYDHRVVLIDDLNDTMTRSSKKNASWLDQKYKTLWGDDFCDHMASWKIIEEDEIQLEALIKHKPSDFVFNGKHFDRVDLPELLTDHNAQKQRLCDWMHAHDQMICFVHMGMAHKLGASHVHKLKQIYTFINQIKQLTIKTKPFIQIVKHIQKQGIEQYTRTQIEALHQETKDVLSQAANITLPIILQENHIESLEECLLASPLLNVKHLLSGNESAGEWVILFFAQCEEIYFGILNVQTRSDTALVVFQEKIVHTWKTEQSSAQETQLL